MFSAISGSALPKRLLRHALSRMDLLDTDAIDIDNLDLAIGRKTVLEFRDVGLKLEKLDRLLQLPPALQIRKARVRLLRVTIPMNFYTSPIIVNIRAVEVSVSLLSPSSDHVLSTSVAVDEALVPNAADLAQSFLDMQSLAEKRELEQALNWTSSPSANSPEQSDAESEPESDADSPRGTGQPLSLPGFLTGFLQGIVDRIQVSISDVTFTFETEVSVGPTTSTPETVSFMLQLDSIDVEGVTTSANSSASTQDDADGSSSPSTSTLPPHPRQRQGKRHISLNKLRAYIVSDLRVFSAFSTDVSPALSTAALSRQSSFAAHHAHLYHGQDFLTGSPALSEHSVKPPATAGLFSELDAVPEQIPEEDPSTPRQSVTNLIQISATNSIESLPPFLSLSSPDNSLSADPSLGASIESQPLPSASALLSSSQELPPLYSSDQDAEHGSQDDEHTRPSLLRSDSSSDAGEDLTASRMFTHDDAESLYLSVASLPGQRGSSQWLQPATNEGSQPATGYEGNQSLDQSVTNAKAGQTEQKAATASSVYVKSIYMPGGWDDQPNMPGAFEADSQVPTAQPEANVLATPKAVPVRDSHVPEEALISGIAEAEFPTPKPQEKEKRPSTPLGPPRMAKEVLSLNRISVFIPSQTSSNTASESPEQPPLKPEVPSMDTSFHPTGPGAFSMYNTMESLPDVRYDKGQDSSDSTQPRQDESIDIELSALETRVDTTVGFLFFSVISKLISTLESSSPPATSSTQQQKTKPAQSTTPIPDIKFSLEKISLLLVNRVRGFECFSGRVVDPDSTPDSMPNIILRADIKDITAGVYKDAGKKKTTISLGKVSFGYAEEHILWFEQESMLHASIRDNFSDRGVDIELTLAQDEKETRMTVLTLPVYTKLDLVKLDGLLDWFGGIPGIFSLSSSMISSFSVMSSRVPAAVPPKSKPKGVRFHDPESSGALTSQSGTKTDIRIGGAMFRLAGKSCRFDLDTSAIKVVIRDDGIRSQVSKIQVTGPCTHEAQSVPMTLQLKNTRLDFLDTPLESDIAALLEMLVPKTTKFKHDDDLMIDTLFAQRRKGPLLRVKTSSVQLRLGSLPLLASAADLGAELEKLAVLAKLLPEDDRPGIMTMAAVDDIQVSVDVGGRIGILHSNLGNLELAHVGFPVLLAVGVGSVYLDRNGDEVLVDMVRNVAVPPSAQHVGQAIRVRMVGDKIEPVVKIRVQDVAVEYRVPTIMDILDIDPDATPQQFEETLAASVASLGESANATLGIKPSDGVVGGEDSGVNSANLGADGDKGKGVAKTADSKVAPAFDLALKDTMIGLNPLNSTAKMYVVLNDCCVNTELPSTGDFTITVNLEKAGVLLTDDVGSLASVDETEPSRAREHDIESWISASLTSRGFASISSISSAVVRVRSLRLPDSEMTRQMLIDMEDALLILETCADSTQTLFGIGASLAPPRPPSTEIKYRTAREVKDLLASISGEAFGRAEGDYDFENDFGHLKAYEGTLDSDFEELSVTSSTADLRLSIPASASDMPVSSDRAWAHMERGEKLFDATSMTDSLISVHDSHEGVMLEFNTKGSTSVGSLSRAIADEDDDEYGTTSELVFEDNYFEQKKEVAEHARLWDTKNGCYSYAPKKLVERSSVRVTVRNVRLFWKMFDGYDWSKTRDAITEAVVGVQNKALERQQAQHRHSHQQNAYDHDEDDGDIVDDETEIGDFLFNSIYIGIAPNQDPGDLMSAINRELGDNGDNESVATSITQTSASTIRPNGSKRTSKSAGRSARTQTLKLQRSRGHKIAIEAVGIDADVAMLPPGSGNTQSCIDIRVKALDVIDYMPGSSWRKFATYDRDAGERELDSSMIHIEVLTVNPVPSLPAYEFVVSMQVLPLRLHVDQDALDFVTRFFSFKDASASLDDTGPPSDPPFVSRFEIQRIPLVLDFKPRRVDYAALRSGKTSEFMNFVTLQDTHIELRRIMLHGVPGFDRVGQMLNDLWTPDVKRFQLATVLAGLSVVRPLADVGNGFRDLVEVPIMEYRKDGRILRSIGKGAVSFVRNTGTGVVKLGAKVAVGTQNALEGAEGLLSKNAQGRPPGSSSSPLSSSPSAGAAATGLGSDLASNSRDSNTGGSSSGGGANDTEYRVISPYANQPLNVVQGLRGGYASLSRDISMARDAIVAVSTQVMESQGAAGAAKAVLEAAPTIIFRPVIGASKAIGQTLLGATNTLDPANRRRVEDKYKQH